MTWNLIKVYGDFIENRRNHSACIIGKFLFIYGGINNYNKHLSDLITVNLESFKSNTLSIEGIE